ncbi:TetR/AcrR family transcriptional regulator [Chelatococcus sp. SYSU_G07232]|uniref:TetR/AcrR family transcriptional regulator n=1 Tax=Chelatococcus albus TaxID=3047466 RepID=A0ABT7ABG6_9HYPH|nr:TetR/AcrR family transcriptional regulator [Chelatococcus sp. SYSU_G07232]MDJ1156668.1 TetR/AcrR family transcriptional regulator [Chelatococcus sp. SYSU_G07232]
MRRPNQELHADRRARILAAAMRVFIRKGLQNATMPDIAAEAGMSVANLYHYVRSKDAILDAFAEEERRETLAAVAALERAEDLVGELLATVEHYLRREDNAEFVIGLEIAVEACRNPAMRKVYVALDREVIDRFSSLLERARDEGRLVADLDARAAATVILGTIEGVFWRRGFDDAFDFEANLAELRRMLAAYLRPLRATTGGRT